MRILLEDIRNYKLEELILLASDQRVKSSLKYRSDFDRVRHLLGELLLQEAVTEVGLDPNVEMKFRSGGKPYVDLPNFYFNISHSNNYILLGYSLESEIGIDIEYIKERDISLASSFFHPKERDFINRSDDKLIDFYRVWTMKESYIKAVGEGLKMDLRSFAVLPESSVDAIFTELREDEYIISVAEIEKK